MAPAQSAFAADFHVCAPEDLLAFARHVEQQAADLPPEQFAERLAFVAALRAAAAKAGACAAPPGDPAPGARDMAPLKCAPGSD